jgi:Holliday junction resolvase-like predicted endonuclease
MSQVRSNKGLLGEERAAQYLVDRGYEILAHDWKHPEFRIQVDLLVRRSGRAYLVEVKHHRWTGSGFERLMTWKQREKLLRFARKLHSIRFKSFGWGFMFIWVNDTTCQVLESVEF